MDSKTNYNNFLKKTCYLRTAEVAIHTFRNEWIEKNPHVPDITSDALMQTLTLSSSNYDDFLKMYNSYNTSPSCPGPTQTPVPLSLLFEISHGEIIDFDESFDSLLEDTIPPALDENIPYPILFFNKIIQLTESSIVNGFGVRKNDNGLMFTWLETEFKDDAFLYEFKYALVNNLIFTPSLEEYFSSSPEPNRIKLISYALNAFALLNNTERDVIITNAPRPKKVKGKRRNSIEEQIRSKHSIFHPTSELHKYIETYNQAKSSPDFRDSFLVKGHWRIYQADRYKNMKGKAQWIKPYVKGTASEIIHKTIHVKK